MAKSEAEIKQTTVEEGTEFKGTLQSTCQVLIRGKVDGDLKAPSVIVSETGTLVGNIKAELLRSGGVLAGRVDADEVYLSGSVRSDTVIRAKTMEVKLHHEAGKLEVTFGECILDVGDDPGAEASLTSKVSEGKPGSRSRGSVVPPPVAANGGEDSGDDSRNGHRSVPPPPG
jgi:cytoskeletal protein CcmA (bactofilin family)